HLYDTKSQLYDSITSTQATQPTISQDRAAAEAPPTGQPAGGLLSIHMHFSFDENCMKSRTR
ncbi:hypothetical protein, partial [Planomicrobium okeanokoites]|uniref:hypothetical protein n=1 Tax=Planomicrobium okeanokoites TaxID=244 RepID=UPI003564262B